MSSASVPASGVPVMASLDDGIKAAVSQINPSLSLVSFGQWFITAEEQTRREKLAPGEATEHAPFVLRLLQ